MNVKGSCRKPSRGYVEQLVLSLLVVFVGDKLHLFYMNLKKLSSPLGNAEYFNDSLFSSIRYGCLSETIVASGPCYTRHHRETRRSCKKVEKEKNYGYCMAVDCRINCWIPGECGNAWWWVRSDWRYRRWPGWSFDRWLPGESAWPGCIWADRHDYRRLHRCLYPHSAPASILRWFWPPHTLTIVKGTKTSKEEVFFFCSTGGK